MQTIRGLKTRLFFFLKTGFTLYKRTDCFGPARTWQGGNAVRLALDAFERQYDRLPDADEKLRLVQKLSWFDQQYQRVPTPEEVAQIIQQLEFH